MKHMLYAVLAASLAMLATSGIVALATAAPIRESPPEAELVSLVDTAIARQLARIKSALAHDGAVDRHRPRADASFSP